jgi:hypothetical protein
MTTNSREEGSMWIFLQWLSVIKFSNHSFFYDFLSDILLMSVILFFIPKPKGSSKNFIWWERLAQEDISECLPGEPLQILWFSASFLDDCFIQKMKSIILYLCYFIVCFSYFMTIFLHSSTLNHTWDLPWKLSDILVSELFILNHLAFERWRKSVPRKRAVVPWIGLSIQGAWGPRWLHRFMRRRHCLRNKEQIAQTYSSGTKERESGERESHETLITLSLQNHLWIIASVFTRQTFYEVIFCMIDWPGITVLVSPTMDLPHYYSC